MFWVTPHTEKVGFQLHYALHPWLFTVLPKSISSSFPIQASPAQGFCGAKQRLLSKLGRKKNQNPLSLQLPEKQQRKHYYRACRKVLTDTQVTSDT